MLVKHGHGLVNSGRWLKPGDRVLVQGSRFSGVLMDDGYPPVKVGRKEPTQHWAPATGFVVVKFGQFAVPMHPELINAQWRELK